MDVELQDLLNQQGVNSAMGGVGGASPWNWGDFLFGSKNLNTGMQTNGALGYGLSGLQGLGNLYMGMQQYGLMKDQLAFSKDAFNKNYGAQKTTTNNQIRSRNFARNAANPGMYQPMTEIA